MPDAPPVTSARPAGGSTIAHYLPRVSLEIPIRWRDVDALGHVNNAVYYSYVEELLAVLLEPVFGSGWSAVGLELDFRRELRLADGIVIARGAVDAVDDASVTIVSRLALEDGTAALDARVVIVPCDAMREARPLSSIEQRALAFRRDGL
jgi:acyl-CoA thioester hydrolase